MLQDQELSDLPHCTLVRVYDEKAIELDLSAVDDFLGEAPAKDLQLYGHREIKNAVLGMCTTNEVHDAVLIMI